MTERQFLILKAIVETYAQSAEPVASLQLAEQFELSPATIRSEMMELERQGLVQQPHTSAGRIPTDIGYRTYVNSLADAPNLPAESRDSDIIKRRLKDIYVTEAAIKEVASIVARRTGNLAVATLPEGQLYKFGLRQFFDHPEFSDSPSMLSAALLIDQLDDWIRDAMGDGVSRISVLIGTENPSGRSSGISTVISRFRSPFSNHSYIGIVGPTRQNYPYVMNLVEQAGKVLEETLNA